MVTKGTLRAWWEMAASYWIEMRKEREVHIRNDTGRDITG